MTEDKINNAQSPIRDFRIALLSDQDARRQTDRERDLRSLIISHGHAYPSIEKWYKSKVLPGVASKERVAFVGYLDRHPVASAIVRRGDHAKFCHLHLRDELRNHSLGELFFILMTVEVRQQAEEIHFTLPESLWESKRTFFESFGFGSVANAPVQYRLFDKELLCSASFDSVWKRALSIASTHDERCLINGLSLENGIIMSLRPENAERILRGNKRIEIRRRFSKRWNGYRVNFLSSSPVSALVGEARIRSVECDTPEIVWERFNLGIGVSWDEYKAYVSGADEVYAVLLEDVRPYVSPVPLTQLSYLVDVDLKAPQSYLQVKENSSWSDAVLLASALHGSFGGDGRTELGQPRYRRLNIRTVSRQLDLDLSSQHQP